MTFLSRLTGFLSPFFIESFFVPFSPDSVGSLFGGYVPPIVAGGTYPPNNFGICFCLNALAVFRNKLSQVCRREAAFMALYSRFRLVENLRDGVVVTGRHGIVPQAHVSHIGEFRQDSKGFWMRVIRLRLLKRASIWLQVDCPLFNQL